MAGGALCAIFACITPQMRKVGRLLILKSWCLKGASRHAHGKGLECTWRLEPKPPPSALIPAAEKKLCEILGLPATLYRTSAEEVRPIHHVQEVLPRLYRPQMDA